MTQPDSDKMVWVMLADSDNMGQWVSDRGQTVDVCDSDSTIAWVHETDRVAADSDKQLTLLPTDSDRQVKVIVDSDRIALKAPWVMSADSVQVLACDSDLVLWVTVGDSDMVL